MGNSHSPKLMPKSVFVTDDATYRKLINDPKGVLLVEDTEALIVPYSAKPEANDALVRDIRDTLISAGRLESGSLVIKNPFEPMQYEPASSAIETFSMAKYYHFANLAKLLGAKSLSFQEAADEQQSSSVKAGASIKASKAAEAKANLNQAATAALKSNLQQNMIFGGSDPQIDQATAYLEKHFLNFDQQMTSLIELRSGANPIQSYHVTVNLSKESESTLNVGLALTEKLSMIGVNLGGSLNKAGFASSNIEVVTEITF